MTPKEKAEELVEKMLNQQSNTEEIYDAKQCALIAVDEILNTKSFLISIPLQDKKYWYEVKQEINLL